MDRAVSRVLQAAFVTIAGLVIVPVAVNIGTGGTPPSWLEPYVGWLWPAALVCVALVIVLEAVSRLGRDTIFSRSPNSPYNFSLALTQVDRYVALRLRGSLAEQVRVALALDERPAAVRQPAHLVQRVGGAEFRLSDGLGVVDVFEQMSESMLILGGPGAGKTTQLLDLAAALTARARAEAPGTAPAIPVVLDLVDWSRLRRRLLPLGRGDRGPRDFVEWLLATLRDRYRIPEVVGRAWLLDDRLTLLLDGLDEVPEAHRERCVQEINRLQRDLGVTRLAVCSREVDYERLAARLELQGAVVIRPLSEEQVLVYFNAVSPRLGGVAQALRADPQLSALLTSPLMLNIMALAYGDRTAEALADDGDLAQRRQHLFDAYVVEVLARRRAHERASPERTLCAVRNLAISSTGADAGVRVVMVNALNAHRAVRIAIQNFVIFWVSMMWGAGCIIAAIALLSPSAGSAALLLAALPAWASWILVTTVRPATSVPLSGYRLLLLTGWLLAGGAATAAVVLTVRWLVMLLLDTPWWIPTVIAVGIAAAQCALLRVYKVADTGLLLVLAGGGLTVGMLVALGPPAEAYAGWAVGFGASLVFSLVVFASLWLNTAGSVLYVPGRIGRLLEPVTVHPRERTSFTLLAVLFTIAMVVTALALPGSWWLPFWQPAAGLLVGLAYAILPGVGLSAAVLNTNVRLGMATAGELDPWRRSFLRFAADRSILTDVGGQYQFIHLLVRDHLAQCDPPELAAQVARRRAELTTLRTAPTQLPRPARRQRPGINRH